MSWKFNLKPPFSWMVRGDIDGFFGLFIDNLLQLMLIVVLCQTACGFPLAFIVGRILPGAALSILLGNFFYAWQARKLSLKTGRKDVTALPYGINTISLLAFIFLIMAPVYHETGNVDFTWKVGLLACLLSGLFEIGGAFFGDWLKRHTPRAALLSALAGVALTFIAMGFTFQIFSSPIIGLVPMVMILSTYAGRIKLPLGLPGGLVAVTIGVGGAWILKWMGWNFFSVPSEPIQMGFFVPKPVFMDLVKMIWGPIGLTYLSVIFPMALFNVLGSLQNLESAEAAGDKFETRPSLLANGIVGSLAAFLGSPFPTTIYIGHPGWKAMGARYGYSILNGVVIALLCLTGGLTTVLKIIPLEATLGILVWIGIVITAQAFQEVPPKHALAVAFGLIPSLGAWALHLIQTTLRAAGTTLFDSFGKFGSDIYIHGVISLSQGFLLSSMILAAILVFIIDRQFEKAVAWALAATFLSTFGFIHAYILSPAGVENKIIFPGAPDFGVAYFLCTLILIGLYYFKAARNRNLPE